VRTWVQIPATPPIKSYGSDLIMGEDALSLFFFQRVTL
jgi:hypothetical protein